MCLIEQVRGILADFRLPYPQGGTARIAVASSSLPTPSVDRSKSSEDESFVMSSLRVRCEAAERRLKAVEGNLAIAQSKQKAAAAREEFLLEELREAGAKLLGMQSTNP